MTDYTFEAALCLQCEGMVIAMDESRVEEFAEVLKGTRITSKVAIWAVFCRKHAPENTDKESYDYTKTLVQEKDILESNSLNRVKTFMLPSVLNPTRFGKMEVRASSVYPLAVTSKMTRFYADMSSETIVVGGIPSSFM
jgi:hypothetical protein